MIRKQILLIKARGLYKEYHSLLDIFSCGKELAEHISPRVSIAKREFNKTIDALAAIDTNCPTTRL